MEEFRTDNYGQEAYVNIIKWGGMKLHIFDNLSPKNLINAIPCFKSQNSDLLGRLSSEFLKSKLLLSEENSDIIRLSRGEGKKFVLDSIINFPNIIFDWGEKSMHSFYDSSDVRDFLEPNIVSKEMLFRLLNLYREELSRHYINYPNRYAHATDKEEVIKRIADAITKLNSYNDLLIIKEWLCFALHTGGNKKFSDISPWVSTSRGNDRYKTAYLYGAGNLRHRLAADKSGIVNRKFVILDYWVPTHEENNAFTNADYVGNKLRSMGVPWYPNRHNEVMVKYVLFPHQLIGYYYFENDELKHYFVNHHYLEEWVKNESFEIGDYLYIDQENINFPSDNPYKVIYSKYGNNFSVFNKR